MNGKVNPRVLNPSRTPQQTKIWPQLGKHILAQYDEDSVVVYQAYKPSIAEYAVKQQQ